MSRLSKTVRFLKILIFWQVPGNPQSGGSIWRQTGNVVSLIDNPSCGGLDVSWNDVEEDGFPETVGTYQTEKLTLFEVGKNLTQGL